VAEDGAVTVVAAAPRRVPDARVALLLAAGVLSRMPSVMLPLAGLLLVAERASLSLGGNAAGAMSLTGGVIALAVSRTLDAGRSRRVLGVSAVAHLPAVALFVAAAGSGNTAAVVAAALVAGLTLAPGGPIVRAAIAAAVPEGGRQQAFAYESMSVEVIWIGGPLLVSLAVWLSGPALGVWLGAALGVAGVVMLAFQAAPGGASAPPPGRWLTAAVAAQLGAFGLMGSALSAVNVAVTESARMVGREAAAGVLVAIWGAGSLLGGWWVARGGRLPATWLVGSVLAALTAALTVHSGLVSLAAGLALAGAPIAPFVIGVNTTASALAAGHAQARVFAAMQAANTVLTSLGSAGGAVLADAAGPRWVYPAAAAVVAGGAILSRARSCDQRGAR
jgi:hypothetical protein